MEQAEIEQAIDALAGGGWRYVTSRQEYLDLFHAMRGGLPDHVILDILQRAFSAAASEYGP